ncbi:alcohol dehydrogenase [Dentipellis sp. KUC8613]|nr:alcohol dehydrogenase [Dentipellis sp. KUC8613]
MAPSEYTRMVLSERPKALVNEQTLRKETVPFDLKPGLHEAVVKVIYNSIDPTMRNWMSDARSYLPPVKIGEVMRAIGVGIVVDPGSESKLKKGDYVAGMPGLQEYAIMKDDEANKFDLVPGAEPIDYLGPLGPTGGLTAYVGLFEIGKIKAGETIVVSAAGGAVGSLVSQFAKKAGARVVGIVGSDEKVEWLKKDVGVDFAFNYKSPTWKDDFTKEVGFTDVYFDNVGGDISAFIYTRMNTFGRVAFCGAITEYNGEDSPGLKNYVQIVLQRLTVQGFIVTDHQSEFEKASKQIASWLADGSIKRRYHIVNGLDKAAEAINLLFSGNNSGKVILAVSDPQAKF